MRDRLIELIDEKQVYGIDIHQPESHNTYLLDNDELADHLLEKGVIVPPCKVGDKAYHLTSVDTLDELNVAEIFEGKVSTVSIEDKVWICCRYDNGLNFWYTERDIGKTVFLTREEADKALERAISGA